MPAVPTVMFGGFQDFGGYGVHNPGVLLERSDEMGTLAGLVHAARDGAPAVVVIEGAAGLGKSRLLAEARGRAAEADMAVLTASARAIERDFGFGVVGQLFARVAQPGGDTLLADAPASVAAILSPPAADVEEVIEAPTFAALHGLYGLVVRLSEQGPLLLAIDDVHWCDAASLRFLAYLRNRLDGLPVLLVCTLRPNEPSTDPAALNGLLDDPGTVWVRPRPLSVSAATTLIETSLGQASDAEFAATCHRVTGGNPLLLEQLTSTLAAERVPPDGAHLRALEQVGPAAVASSVLLRLGRLGDDAVRTAQALAVLGDDADLAHVADLAALDIALVASAVAGLAGIDLVRHDPPLGFVHPVVAAAVYRDVPMGERQLLHLRAADLLRRAGAPAEQVAGHLLRAPATGDPTVVDDLVRAAAVATQKGAVEGAAGYLQRALAEPPAPERRGAITWALGRAEASRRGLTALPHLRAAHDEALEPEQRAEVAELLGAVLIFTGSGGEGLQVLRDAATALPHGSDLRQRLEAFGLYAVLFGTGDRTELDRLTEHRSLRGSPGLGAQMLAALAAVHWMYAGGPAGAVSDLALRALENGALVSTRPSWAAYALTTLTFADRPEAEGWWDRITAAGYEAGSLTAMVSIMHGRGDALRRRGELADAEVWSRDATIAIDQWGFTDPVPSYAHAQLAGILLDRGDLAGARRAWSTGRDVGASDPGTRRWLGCQVELLVAEGRMEPAVAAAEAYADRFGALVPNPMDVPWRSLKAQALHHLGRRDEARALAEAELELSRAWGAPATVARTLRTLGALEGGTDGVLRLEEAVAEVEHSPARLEHARALAALGVALGRSKGPVAARGPLRRALAIATSCDAHGLTERVRVDLLDAGGRPRRTALEGVESLTPGELRVVRLVAEGRSNRQVGETLFVSPKTVAMHLSNAFRKLGVSSRHELASVLAGQKRA